jgi:hypothetical protein
VRTRWGSRIRRDRNRHRPQVRHRAAREYGVGGPLESTPGSAARILVIQNHRTKRRRWANPTNGRLTPPMSDRPRICLGDAMMNSNRVLILSTAAPIPAPLLGGAISSSSILAGMVVLVLGACGDMDKVPAMSVAGGDAGAEADTPVDFSCLPDCYRQAFETCQPAGACAAEVAPGSSVARTEDWICFENGVRTHLVGTMDGGSLSSTTDISTSTGACRRLEVMEGTTGGFFQMKDGNGVVLATATMTSYPGITIACGNMEKQLDRTTACGRAALLELSAAGTADMLAHCTQGSCPH